MDHEGIIRNLRRQLLIERVAVGVIAFALMTSWAFSHFRDGKSLILVDGKPVVCLSSEQDAEEVLCEIKKRAGGDPSDTQFRQAVRVTRAPGDAHPVSRHRAMRTVSRYVSPLVPRWAIIANGKPVVAVPSRDIAGEALDLAKLRFGQLAKNLLEEPQFKENVTVHIAGTDPSIYRRTAQQAVDFLFSKPVPVMRDAVYTVRSGDIASVIASRSGLSLEALTALNPGVNLARLQIGDKLRIKASDAVRPRLTVVVRDVTQRAESMPAPELRVSSARLRVGKMRELSPGRDGLRNVKVATLYENGRATGSEVIEEEIIREPVPRQIAVGIKPYGR